jgi:ABC-type transport system involved in multi-copper enzyme maturation permease subunit
MQKEFRLVLLPLAVACLASLACGFCFVDSRTQGLSAYVSGPLRTMLDFAPVVLVMSLTILAGLSFGSEFQQRTIALLISQPLSRSRIWSEKMGVLAWSLVIVLAAWAIGTLITLGFRNLPTDWNPNETTFLKDVVLATGGFVIVTFCSATFWTLVARSVIGGIVFNLGAQLLATIATFLVVERVFHGSSDRSLQTLEWVAPIYAASLLFLGRRKFLRLQINTPLGGEHPRSESLAAIKWDIAWMRCRPSSLFLNLLRKELRLNKPLFVIAAFFIVCRLLAFLVLKASSAERQTADFIATLLTVIYMSFIFVLSGTISLGEEKVLGTHLPLLTLPVSSRKLG